MLVRLIGQATNAALLKQGLDASSVRSRAIAHRVANAATPQAGFAEALDRAQGGGAAEKVDLEREMVALADEQIRFEATARLLQKVYAGLRSAVRERT